jgi:hypothetical protein
LWSTHPALYLYPTFYEEYQTGSHLQSAAKLHALSLNK